MAYRYRDVNEINNQILLQVKQQNAEIKALLQTCMFANYDFLLFLHF